MEEEAEAERKAAEKQAEREEGIENLPTPISKHFCANANIARILLEL